MNHRVSQMYAIHRLDPDNHKNPYGLNTMNRALFNLHLCYFQSQSQTVCTALVHLNGVVPAYIMGLHPMSTEYILFSLNFPKLLKNLQAP